MSRQILSTRNLGNEQGAVSLFIVLFTMILMTVLTVSFVRLMVSDQQQATVADLSQSAYDSALAGVEDAKRALLACESGDDAACAALTTDSCTMLEEAGIASFVEGDSGNLEVPIRTSLSTADRDAKLDQAYTCVTVETDTDDYTGVLTVGESAVIPLEGVAAFDSVELSWFSYEDVSSNNPAADRNLNLPSGLAPDGSGLMTTPDNWPNDRPSLMRAHLIQYSQSGFSLDSFDQPEGDSTNASTLFLYPSSVGLDAKDFISDGRQNANYAPSVIACESSLAVAAYACTVTLELPDPINGSENTREAYLRLSSLYNNAHFTLSLKNGAETVKFDNVLPAVDSTGRANDQFRRVVSRIRLSGDFPYPENAVDITGNLCKNFVVTDEASDYSTSCTP